MAKQLQKQQEKQGLGAVQGQKNNIESTEAAYPMSYTAGYENGYEAYPPLYGEGELAEVDQKPNFKFPKELLEEYREKYPYFVSYIENNIKNDLMNNELILEALERFSGGNLTPEQVEKDATWGEGSSPLIVIRDMTDGQNGQYVRGHGSGGEGVFEQANSEHYIVLDETLIIAFEEEMSKQNKSTDLGKKASLLVIMSTFWEEYVHYGDGRDGIDYDEVNDIPKEKNLDSEGDGYDEFDEGNAAESYILGNRDMILGNTITPMDKTSLIEAVQTLFSVEKGKLFELQPDGRALPTKDAPELKNPSIIPTLPKR
ncbi:hypothetical protein SapgrDRAFT_3428 [Saprospira grandis DSM 2844]|uniref:Uncharacterized protein n=1 Tax=Saprospira grandis DSM 2844 TaxID=694433 RepID=J0Y0K7_9BACT|nr:hypothetical protein [Saprospira grandis]EJF55066.1 hypothetical protein SapgrDRAFT_3428 [Saprospira grandis DSM 2844]